MIRTNNTNNNSKQNECNCKTRMNCPINGLCNLDDVVYQGIIYPKENVKDRNIYIEFPRRNGNLDTLIINFLYPMNIWKTKQPYLSNFRSLKNKGLTPEVQWSILKKSNASKCFDSRCNLCLEEKNTYNDIPRPEKLLNQRCELIARWRHRNEFKR